MEARVRVRDVTRVLIRRAAARARSQVVGYLTGGPQRYTGQPMAAAHKHLGITPAEWDTFMADAALTMDALRIDAATQAELGHIFAAFRSDCIVEPGHAVPKDPKLCRRPPDGDSVYAHAGGVYPLAQFCDALVDLGVEARLVACDDVKTGGCATRPGSSTFSPSSSPRARAAPRRRPSKASTRPSSA